MRALLYACTTAADLGRTVLDEKIPELRLHAGIQGWEVAGEFTDANPTGTGKRPGFDALCEAVKAGSGDVVLTNDISDLCWDLSTGLARLEQLGVGVSVGLVCIENSFDATTPTGAMRLRDAMALVFEHGRGRRRKRQRIGYLRAMAKAAGEPIAGRPRLALNPFQIKSLWERGLSQREIRDELKRLGCPISQGHVAKLVSQADGAGDLDHAARAAAMEKRGGRRKGGRPKKEKVEN